MILDDTIKKYIFNNKKEMMQFCKRWDGFTDDDDYLDRGFSPAFLLS